MSKNDRMVGISRRTLVKSTAIGSLALAAGGFSLPFTLRSAAATVQQASEKVIWGACSVNCGSRCALRLHVKDNEVTWVETDNTGSDEYGNHQVRACLRGRSIRRRINHPDRLNYPMKRVGTRGEGKFERISWDEALDTIASSLKKTVEQYGNEAVYIQYSSGIVGGNMTRSTSDGWETQWPLPEASLAPLVTAFQTQCEETHAQAWQRLFVGPWALPSPPWGSVWLDRESVLFGDSTLALRQWMREKGIQFEMKQNEPEDHFGSLLLMAAWLAENGRQTECEELLAWHLFPWSTRFLDVFIEKAEHPFYRALGELARLTLAQWQSQLLIPVAVKPLFR